MNFDYFYNVGTNKNIKRTTLKTCVAECKMKVLCTKIMQTLRKLFDASLMNVKLKFTFCEGEINQMKWRLKTEYLVQF